MRYIRRRIKWYPTLYIELRLHQKPESDNAEFVKTLSEMLAELRLWKTYQYPLRSIYLQYSGKDQNVTACNSSPHNWIFIQRLAKLRITFSWRSFPLSNDSWILITFLQHVLIYLLQASLFSFVAFEEFISSFLITDLNLIRAQPLWHFECKNTKCKASNARFIIQWPSFLSDYNVMASYVFRHHNT